MATSFGKRIFETTTAIETAMASRAAGPAKPALGGGLARTAPGQLLHASGQIVSLQEELTQLRERLEKFDGSMPALKLDPAKVRRSAWANRHEQSFQTAAFARFKADIAGAGGNVQPILVRDAGEGAYEVVFGHRRLQACLELGIPVLAVVWDKPMPDLDLFVSMDRENREREDLSAYEQGMSYLGALERGLFRSERHLSDSIGVSRAWISKALKVAKLPQAVVEAFASPLDIKPAQAEAVDEALRANEKAVFRRAEKLRQLPARLPSGKVVSALLGLEAEARSPVKLKIEGRSFGTWHRDSRGRTVLVLDSGLVDDQRMMEIAEAIAKLLPSPK
jgi:ParB family transcriptional regulator, chromosome partitioning protein